jgi:hypothetical protein
VHGLCHPRLGQFQAAHIANDNRLVGINHRFGKLVQGVFAPPRSAAMQSLGLASVAATLRLLDL